MSSKKPGLTLPLAAALVVGSACADSRTASRVDSSPQHTSSSVEEPPVAEPPAAPVPTPEDDSRRLKFARWLQSKLELGTMGDPVVSVEDGAEPTLVITADEIAGEECFMFAASSVGDKALLAGFERLTCRSRRGGRWDQALDEPLMESD